MAIQPEDLQPLEQVLLGVLSLGLPPSKAAGDDSFRVDYVCAVTYALRTGGQAHDYLSPDGTRPRPEFRQQLEATVTSLVERGLLAHQPAGMPVAPGGFDPELAVDLVDPDVHPTVLDRYLGQQCLELLFQDPNVYPFLMERYTRSGEVWRRLRERELGSNV